MSDVFDKVKDAVARVEDRKARLATANAAAKAAQDEFDAAVGEVEKFHDEFTAFVQTVVPSIGRTPRQL